MDGDPRARFGGRAKHDDEDREKKRPQRRERDGAPAPSRYARRWAPPVDDPGAPGRRERRISLYYVDHGGF